VAGLQLYGAVLLIVLQALFFGAAALLTPRCGAGTAFVPPARWRRPSA